MARTSVFQGVAEQEIRDRETSSIGKQPRRLTSSARRDRLRTILESLAAANIRPLATGLERVFERYREVRPSFSSTWVSPQIPDDAELITEYDVDGVRVRIFYLPEEMDSLYHVEPPEYCLPPEHAELIYRARSKLSEHYPRGLRLEKPEEARTYVKRVGEPILRRLAESRGIRLGDSRREEARTVTRLAEILAKYTAGLGIAETFLADEKIQDVYVDAPASRNPVYVTLGGIPDRRFRGRCRTNVVLGEEDVESMLSRFRYESGRPFSEAFPVLEHNIGGYDTRVTVIGKPLSPEGIAMALRRHSTDPWTLPKLIAVRSLTPQAAGLLSFLIDGRSTILVAGGRGAGKTSILGALMLEFPQSQRILTIEDTLELPTSIMQKLGYKVQSMFVQSSLGGKGEVTADEALRVSLRMGESAIVLGEGRGQEARTLYEAMRAGTAGSSVLGTFHADSAKAVFERVVHDMQIPPKSFNATDIVLIAGVTRPSGIQKEVRRVIQIAEVRKEGGEEGSFQDLLIYDEASDSLVETDVFRYGSERIAKIARQWGISMEEALRNIEARAAIRETLVEVARERELPDLLGAEWVVRSNNAFWRILEDQTSRGAVDYEGLLDEWKSWFERSLRYAGG